MTDQELIDLSWEDPINALLEYEPFLLTSKTWEHGQKYSHPMIGDLKDLFQDGMTGVRITHRLCWGPNWQEILEHIKINVVDLAKWTDELLELCPNYHWTSLFDSRLNDEGIILTSPHCGRESRHPSTFPFWGSSLVNSFKQKNSYFSLIISTWPLFLAQIVIIYSVILQDRPQEKPEHDLKWPLGYSTHTRYT